MPNNTISVITIQGDDNYYNTSYQIKKSNESSFEDRFEAAASGSQAINLFAIKSSFRNKSSANSSVYAVSSIDTDPSGNQRKILSPNVDYFSSSSIDAYKNGIEITQNKHWTAGLAKFTAGTAGHLYENTFFGVNSMPITASAAYYELDVFDPIAYIQKSSGSNNFQYPIVTSDVNQRENEVLNGIIEPFSIRPVVANFSLYFPFEPHSTKGQFGNGNTNWRLSSDSVESVFVYDTDRNSAFFLDASDVRKISTGTSGSGSVPVGPPDGYFNLEENFLKPFKDFIYPRNLEPSASYGSMMTAALMSMTASRFSENYVTQEKKSATAGFDCEFIEQGVDSVTYRNSMWNSKNRDNRRHRKTMLDLRESESYMRTDAKFNDNNTVLFRSGSNFQTVEYPVMIPLELTSSLQLNSTVKSELFKNGSIKVTRGVKSGLYETPLSDSILSSKRRLGTL